ncbi:Sec-independent protein translocase protein TatB [Zoogloea sp.]|uniref:Sec-independent protein translocase protein TatB n=1 Tax=Zoogloea sp. TaxID=49181 RepID=UPI002612ACD4|nr:Sec-independent protein translocase protein TatB [Zoogloea sp.]MDD3354305.1 Sec-independent protein translocase protein TatB [Zoogloea sp.]
MFDIGFSELMVIGVVALLVLGPERLPKVARTTGHLLGRLQRYVSDVKSDINREMQLEELKKLQEEARQSAMAFESSVRSEVAGVSASLESASSAVADLESSLKAGGASPTAAASPGEADASAALDRQLADAERHAGPLVFPEPPVAASPPSASTGDALPPEMRNLKS